MQACLGNRFTRPYNYRFNTILEAGMRFCWAQYTLWAIIIALGVLSMLAGCGAKGDLFLPPEVVERIKQEKLQEQLALEAEQQRREQVLAVLDEQYAAADTPPPGSPERQAATSALLTRLEAAYVAPPPAPDQAEDAAMIAPATQPEAPETLESRPESPPQAAGEDTAPPDRDAVLDALQELLEAERERLLRLYEELTTGLPELLVDEGNGTVETAPIAAPATAADGTMPEEEGEELPATAEAPPSPPKPEEIARKRRVIEDLLDLIDEQ
jgi:predicted small lipoprotein YifL